MKQQIKRFSILQTAKVLGILYAILGLLFFPIFLLATLVDPQNSFGLAFAFLMPAFYALIGFVGTIIGCAIYNWIAGWVGGIEVELSGPALEADNLTRV